MWEDAFKVAKEHGSENAYKQVKKGLVKVQL